MSPRPDDRIDALVLLAVPALDVRRDLRGSKEDGANHGLGCKRSEGVVSSGPVERYAARARQLGRLSAT